MLNNIPLNVYPISKSRAHVLLEKLVMVNTTHRRVAYHPKAYLSLKRNVQRGLYARTRLVRILETKRLTAGKLSQETTSSYTSVLHHLHLLEEEEIVLCIGKRPYFWELTGIGQQQLIDARSKK